MAEETKEKPRVQVTELAQLSARDVEYVLEFPDADMVIPGQVLTLSEWNACDRAEPVVPRVTVGGGPKGPIYDDNDPGYLQAREARAERVIYRRVLKSIKITVPGETIDEQIEVLRASLGANAMNALILLVLQAHGGLEARVQNRAASFQPSGHSGE